MRRIEMEFLRSIGVQKDQDFYELSSDQVERLLEEARRVGYRKPKNANGSTARYFYARLQREMSK